MQKKFKCIPLDKIYITQYFGENPNFYLKYGMKGHNGIDFRTKFNDSPLGKREIYAIDDGVVIKSIVAKFGGYGTYCQIQSEDGSVITYGHQFYLKVTKGQTVKAGEVIGISDNTGDSTGPHLHITYKPNNADLKNGYKGAIDFYDMLPIPDRNHFAFCQIG